MVDVGKMRQRHRNATPAPLKGGAKATPGTVEKRITLPVVGEVSNTIAAGGAAVLLLLLIVTMGGNTGETVVFE